MGSGARRRRRGSGGGFGAIPVPRADAGPPSPVLPTRVLERAWQPRPAPRSPRRLSSCPGRTPATSSRSTPTCARSPATPSASPPAARSTRARAGSPSQASSTCVTPEGACRGRHAGGGVGGRVEDECRARFSTRRRLSTGRVDSADPAGPEPHRGPPGVHGRAHRDPLHGCDPLLAHRHGRPQRRRYVRVASSSATSSSSTSSPSTLNQTPPRIHPPVALSSPPFFFAAWPIAGICG